MDHEKVVLVLKWLAALIVIVLFFTVVLPKYKQVDEFITNTTEEFLRLIFHASSSVGKKSENYAGTYIESDLANQVAAFDKLFFTVNSNAQLKKVLQSGKAIVLLQPNNIKIIQKVAFLYYMNGEFENAVENYSLVLDSVSKRDMTYTKLRHNLNYRAIKRALLELSALHYDLNEKDKMINYYKQFLKVAYRDQAYQEFILGGINEQNVCLGIFSNFGGVGLFSYKKAIDELVKYLQANPSHKQVLAIIGKYNFEVANLFFEDAPDDYIDYIRDAKKYLNQALDFSIDTEEKEIMNNLSQLEKLEKQYLEQ